MGNQEALLNLVISKAMESENIPFQTINWDNIPKTTHPGTTGTAWWQTIQFKGLRVRVVEYSKGYLADHWCRKGHIVYCLEGEFTTELENGESFRLAKGMSYIVSDELSSHRSVTESGVKLLIIDGDFLKRTL
jgi:quercetin dioxygenase-like cupin family protein